MDNFIVSARKYRPATFDTVVGQQHITGTLKNAIKNNQLAQAFLFCGPRGVGKTTCARILAKTINCYQRTEQAEACGTCESCLAFQNGNSFSIHELDAASNNSVDDIRALNDQVRIPPQSGKYKIYIIDEVHMLSQQAFNAFLKTLEEPPSYAIFILATTEKHKILPTILSRCQIFDFNRIKVDDMAMHLAEIAQKENVAFDQDALHLIAQKADGGLRDALSMFDQIVSFSNKNLSYQAVIDNLNVLDYDYYFKVTDAVLEENGAQALRIFDQVLASGFDGSHFIAGLSDHFRDLLVTKDEVTISLLEVSQGIKERYLAQSKLTSVGLLLSALNIANQCEVNYKNSRNQRLQVELALLKICHISSAISLSQEVPTEATQSTGDKKKTTDSSLASAETSAEQGGGVASNVARSVGESKTATDNYQNASNTTRSASSSQPTESKSEISPESSLKGSSQTPLVPNQSKQEVASTGHGEEAPAKPKLFIPSLKDVKISSSIPSLDSVYHTKEDDKSDEPEYIHGTEKEEFSEEEFLRHWKILSEKLKDDGKISLYTLMSSNTPELVGVSTIKVIVENGVQEHLLINFKVEILNYLRFNLKNYTLDLDTIIQTNTIIRKPITDIEKYQAMVLKNPHLDELRKGFNLGFE